MALFDPSNHLFRLALRITWSERGRSYTAATVAEAFGISNPARLYNTLCAGFERGCGPIDEDRLRAAYVKDVRRPVTDREWSDSLFVGREIAHHMAKHLEKLEAERRERRRVHLSAAGRWSRRPHLPEETRHA